MPDTANTQTDDRGLTIHDFARLLSATPAKIFGLGQRKGRIQVGLDADLTILDPNAKWKLDETKQHSSAGWSPYHGWELQGKVTKTILRGQILYDGLQVVAEPGTGRFVAAQHQP